MQVLPKISVITICFNAAAVIERTLQNVSSQNYPAIEYIVVDGASTDRTREIINSYKSKITHLLSEPDQGLYDAMNKGLALATGEYVVFMNSGDMFYDRDTLRHLMEKGKDADFVYGRPLVIEKNGRQNTWHKPIPYADSLVPESFLPGMVVCHQASMIRRNIAPKFEIKYHIAADIDWIIKVVKSSKRSYFHDGYVCYFYRGGLSGKYRLKALWERFEILSFHFGFQQALKAQFEILISLIK